jgi:ERCC4-type nuclease
MKDEVDRRASDLQELTIAVDTRERYPYKFAGRPVEQERVALPVGDYAVRHGDQPIAAVERKTPEDFTKSLVDGSLNLGCRPTRPTTAARFRTRPARYRGSSTSS